MSPEDLKAKLLTPISALGIKNGRLKTCLANENLVDVGEILALGETALFRIPNFGRLSMDRLKAHLADFGLPLGSVKFKKDRFVPQEETFEKFIEGAEFDAAAAEPAPNVDKPAEEPELDLMASWVLSALPSKVKESFSKPFVRAVARSVAQDKEVVECVDGVASAIGEILPEKIMGLSGYQEFDPAADKGEAGESIGYVWTQAAFLLSSVPEVTTEPMRDDFRAKVSDALTCDKAVHGALKRLDATVQSVSARIIREKLEL